MLNIAVVRPVFSESKGGGERYCLNVMRQLAREGHRATAVAHTLDPHLEGEFPFVRVDVDSRSSSARNRSFAANAARAIAREPFDITYASSRVPGADVCRFSERVHAHWLGIRYPGCVRRTLEQLNPRHRVILQLEKSLVTSRNTQRIVVQSELDRQLLKTHYGVPDAKLCLIHNGVDVEKHHPLDRAGVRELRRALGLDPDRPVIAFVAACDPVSKGLDTLLRAIGQLANAAVQVVVVGRGNYSRFARLARRLRIERQVQFLGWRSNVTPIYQAADLLVHPNLYEPSPNVVLESLACGTPAVTTIASASADIIVHRRDGYLLNSNSPVIELAQVLREHLQLPSQHRAAIQTASRRKAESLTIATHMKALTQLFQVVCQAKLRDAPSTSNSCQLAAA